MSATGVPDGEPMKVGVAVSDVMTGLYAAIGILSALHAREKTGEGQMVDLALLDCTLAGMTNLAQFYLTAGKPAARLGNAHSTIVPYQAFETADGHIVVAVGNDSQFRRFCEAIGFTPDAKFATNTGRLLHRDELVPKLQEKLKSKHSQDWMDIFLKVNVPAGPVNAMDKIFALAQTEAREMKITMKHPLTPAPAALVGSPLKLSETPVEYRFSPPFRGQHTREILETVLKIAPDDIQALIEKRIIEAP